MVRAVSLLIVLAHVCVMSMPCFDADPASDALRTAISQGSRGVTGPQRIATESPPAALATPKPADASAHHGHHGHHAVAATTTPAPDHSNHADATPTPTSMAGHAHHDHGDRSDVRAAPQPDSKVADLQLRAKCMCGCSKGAAAPATSSRVGFALLSAPPERLLEIAPPFEAWLIVRVPELQVDAFDHVPILS